jgi:hypothetical protein
MSPSTITVRNAIRKNNRRSRGRHGNSNAVITRNREARSMALRARDAAAKIIGKVGLQWGRIELSGLTGGRILAYMQAAALTKPHGFVPGQDPTYKSLNPTKGFRFVPA